VINFGSASEKQKERWFAFRVFERSGGVKRETEPASDSSLEGNTSSLYTMLKKPEDKSRTGRSESVEGLKICGITSSDHIYYNVN